MLSLMDFRDWPSGGHPLPPQSPGYVGMGMPTYGGGTMVRAVGGQTFAAVQSRIERRHGDADLRAYGVRQNSSAGGHIYDVV
jgi:hypothetical protein